MKTKIEIKRWITGSVLFEFETENNSVGETVKAAILSGAYLSGAYLSGAYLRDANLRGADLSGANLRGANLRGADLSDANLSDANLNGAYLSGANLSGACLSDANLSGADLRGANLSDANLSDADLSDIRIDFFGRMLTQKNEIPALRDKLLSGEINGSAYEGACSCFCGTIAVIKKCRYDNLPGLKIDYRSHTERWFLGIKEGDTPVNSQIAKITLDWIDEFLILIK